MKFCVALISKIRILCTKWCSSAPKFSRTLKNPTIAVALTFLWYTDCNHFHSHSFCSASVFISPPQLKMFEVTTKKMRRKREKKRERNNDRKAKKLKEHENTSAYIRIIVDMRCFCWLSLSLSLSLSVPLFLLLVVFIFAMRLLLCFTCSHFRPTL